MGEMTQLLVVKCFAEQLPDNQWQAFSIQFGLAVQGESLVEVRHKLELMIRDYITDVLIGEDREYARQLLNRRAPLSIQAKYYWLKLTSHGDGGNQRGSTYDEPVPLCPAPC